ncbi:hypothetical protein PIB30_076712, partial [Stylosanthes scabra]|nr:hypothetical protein [Stylosanthes scabra]
LVIIERLKWRENPSHTDSEEKEENRMAQISPHLHRAVHIRHQCVDDAFSLFMNGLDGRSGGSCGEEFLRIRDRRILRLDQEKKISLIGRLGIHMA